MSLNLQKQLATLLDLRPNANFLDLRVMSNFNEIIEMTNTAFATFAIRLTQIFLLSDFILYVGIVVTVLILGSQLRLLNNSLLTKLLINTSGFFIYIGLLLNICGLLLGFNFMAAHNLVMFDSSYTISFYSQLAKLAISLISLILYNLFSSAHATKMRAVELPLLIHVSVALSSTIISSTNFVLLLLALEGFSLTLYIMTTLGRQYGGVMASVKYFAFGTLGSIFLL
jgi:NADH:ubiquinone oxidoreductase subunit 2 (subunit N)